MRSIHLLAAPIFNILIKTCGNCNRTAGIKGDCIIFLSFLVVGSQISAATVDDLTFALINDNTEYEVSDCNTSATGALTIPSTYNGKSVTTIGDQAFSSCRDLTSIVIPESVIVIERYAFNGCSNLTSINIPSSLTKINEYTFYYCSGLTNISLPNSLTSIGNNAFSGCRGLVSITIPGSVTSIEKYAFASCTGLTSITLPNSLTSIGQGAFGSCTGLTSITLPDSLTYIGPGAFGSCSGLTSITLPDSLTYIGQAAFGTCSGLTSISIPSSVTYMHDQVFTQCSSLEEINFEGAPPSFYTAGSPPAITTFDNMWSSPYIYVRTNPEAWFILKDAYQLPIIYVGPPKILNQPQDILALEGSPVELDVVATDVYDTTLTYQWKKNGVNIDGATASIFSIQSLAVSDIGNYRVEVTNDVGTAISESALVDFSDTYSVELNQTIDQLEADVVQLNADIAALREEFNLTLATEVEQARQEGITLGIDDGINLVTTSPESYDLYTESSILDLNVSNPIISMTGVENQAEIEFAIESSTDLETWRVDERIQRLVEGQGDKYFVRINSGPAYIEPTVVVYEHPTLGNILTTREGQVLYRFAYDVSGQDPTYTGSSWDLAPATTDPEADVGITATLGSGTFSNVTGGPWLTINGHPVYTYPQDTEPNQASGHGSGDVWFTVKPDGSTNTL